MDVDVTDLEDGGRLLVRAGDREIGIFRIKGRLVAWQNRCPHQGGPVCTGLVLGKTELELRPDKTVIREVRSESVQHLACPWHGWEFDVETGVCAAWPKRRLLAVEIEERDGRAWIRD